MQADEHEKKKKKKKKKEKEEKEEKEKGKTSTLSEYRDRTLYDDVRPADDGLILERADGAGRVNQGAARPEQRHRGRKELALQPRHRLEVGKRHGLLQSRPLSEPGARPVVGESGTTSVGKHLSAPNVHGHNVLGSPTRGVWIARSP